MLAFYVEVLLTIFLTLIRQPWLPSIWRGRPKTVKGYVGGTPLSDPDTGRLCINWAGAAVC
jgi:hypothetical protein